MIMKSQKLTIFSLLVSAALFAVCIGLLVAIYVKQQHLSDRIESDQVTTTTDPSNDTTTDVTQSPADQCPEAIASKLGFRLDPRVWPRHYNIFVVPYLDTAAYFGTVSVSLRVTRLNSKVLYFHANPNLAILADGVQLRRRRDNEKVGIVSQCRYSAFELWALEVDVVIEGEYVIDIPFQGDMRLNGQVGLYTDTYFDPLKGTNRSELVYFLLVHALIQVVS